jgi:hypothetical protein
LGAHPSFADSVLGDLAEERKRRASEQGSLAADWWYAREALRSVPHLVWNALRHGGVHGAVQLTGLLVGIAAPAAIVVVLLLRDPAPVALVFEGQRGGEVNGAVLNSRHPVQLVTRALDAHGRTLPASTVHYRWLTGDPVDVTSSGVVTCSESGDAELRASAGAVATTLIVRCRPVSYVGGDMILTLIAGESGRRLPIIARAPNGYPEHLLAGDFRVEDTSVAVMKGWMIRPVAPGATKATVKIGDGLAHIWVIVYERVKSFAGLRPDQRFVTAPVRIAAGDSIRWPLPTGEFWLRFTPESRAQPAPKVTVHGQMTCVPAIGTTDQARCKVSAPGAWVRITHPSGSRGEIAGNLALDRRDP